MSAPMRITGGQARGIPLVVPKGDAVRPATDGMRQSVFSSLGDRVVGARFLDLFAGSGAYGLEALSRGAASGGWVEQDRRAVDCLHKNLAAVGKSLGRNLDESKVMTGDAMTAPWSADGLPDLVFVDPPYDLIETIATPLFARLTELLAAHPAPWVIFEMPGEITLDPAGWRARKRLGKGVRQPSVVFFERATSSPDAP